MARLFGNEAPEVPEAQSSDEGAEWGGGVVSRQAAANCVFPPLVTPPLHRSPPPPPPPPPSLALGARLTQENHKMHADMKELLAQNEALQAKCRQLSLEVGRIGRKRNTMLALMLSLRVPALRTF